MIAIPSLSTRATYSLVPSGLSVIPPPPGVGAEVVVVEAEVVVVVAGRVVVVGRRLCDLVAAEVATGAAAAVVVEAIDRLELACPSPDQPLTAFAAAPPAAARIATTTSTRPIIHVGVCWRDVALLPIDPPVWFGHPTHRRDKGSNSTCPRNSRPLEPAR